MIQSALVMDHASNLDHLLPRKYNHLVAESWNLVLACRRCNNLKRTWDAAIALDIVDPKQSDRDRLLEKAVMRVRELRQPLDLRFEKQKPLLKHLVHASIIVFAFFLASSAFVSSSKDSTKTRKVNKAKHAQTHLKLERKLSSKEIKYLNDRARAAEQRNDSKIEEKSPLTKFKEQYGDRELIMKNGYWQDASHPDDKFVYRGGQWRRAEYDERCDCWQ